MELEKSVNVRIAPVSNSAKSGGKLVQALVNASKHCIYFVHAKPENQQDPSREVGTLRKARGHDSSHRTQGRRPSLHLAERPYVHVLGSNRHLGNEAPTRGPGSLSEKIQHQFVRVLRSDKEGLGHGSRRFVRKHKRTSKVPEDQP